jgi:hypothetical protein
MSFEKQFLSKAADAKMAFPSGEEWVNQAIRKLNIY